MRIGIIGTGWVGASVAISTLHGGVARELLLADARHELAEGEALDLAHGGAFVPTVSVRAVEVEAMVDCDAVVIAAGRAGTASQSRLDLLRDNAAIVRDLVHRLRGLRGLLVLVTNPVDVLVRIAVDTGVLPPERVLGTGTMLDTARLRQILGARLAVEPRSIHAQVLGEHGDSSVPVWSSAQVAGVPLRAWPGWRAGDEGALGEQVRRAASEIIRRKGATNHAIGLVTATLLRWALRGEQRVLCVSRVHPEVEGLVGVALSLPTVVGRDGAGLSVFPAMDDGERAALRRSAEVLDAAYQSLGR